VGDSQSEVIGDTGPPGSSPAASAGSVGGDTGPAVGSRIAGYRIEARIGRGGMAEVFRAIDEHLGRQVALKVLAPELSRDEAFRQRFIRESRVAAALDDPHIIPVYEAGEADGVLFIAMRYVRGGDVKSLITTEGPLRPERVTAIVSPIAAALDAAHAAGLVHRDVKPGNMLLDSTTDQSAHVYLTDFGLTLSADHGELTSTGHFVGTLDYIAPEQIEGRSVDGRVDQYALACAAFEMLSGSPPFARDQGLAIMWAQMSEAPPPLTSSRPELSPAVDEVFARAMAKSPANRFATCGQFAEALRAALALQGPDDRDRLPAPSGTVNIPLKQSFRYVHEPSRVGEEALTSLGNDALIAELQSRILHSRGGTFLVTGFRGVGKSTLVLRALDEIVARNAPSDLVLPVTLSVARSTTTDRLLFAIVRRIFETLSDSGVLERLPPQTRHALLVAYMRTSLSFKETQSEARERSAAMDLSIGPAKVVKALADFAVPTVSMSSKRSHSLATEAAFLAYSETDAEYDLMRIVSLVDGAPDLVAERRSWLRRLWPWLARPDQPRLHLIIVIDEVDKLTTDAAGLVAVEELLSGIKNVLTMPGAHFLVVAGPDLHDRAIRDAARGNGVYESVFGWRLYVPCIWDAPDRLVADVVSSDAKVDDSTLALLADYLRFKARGVPRKLLQEINGFVAWDGIRPSLQIGAKDMERVEFYARLERILRAYFETSGRARLFPVAIDEDRWRLGGYYVVDWVLQSEGEPFTAADLLREGDDAEFDPLLRISRRNVDRLLDHLAEHRILEVVREMSATATVLGDIADSSATVFRLAEEVRYLLYGFAAQHESERGAREVSLARAVTPAAYAAGAPPAHAAGATVMAMPPPRVLAGRYELGELIGQGGMSSVYKGRDLVTGRQVVVKLLRPSLGDDPQARARFRREADIARRLTHPQIAQTYDVLDEPDQSPALVMEWLNGPNLRDLILNDGPMPATEVAATGRVLAAAMDYIAGERVVRLDLKPSNIIMADRGPVITDLGIALRVDTDSPGLTQTGQFVGTPAFMAPELIEGREPDPRSDIYALGLVLFYCLAGRGPWEDLVNPVAIMTAIMSEQVDLANLPISPEFRQVLGRALAKERDERFQSAADLRDALTETPEWRLVGVGPGAGDDDIL
jgi:serine/threonine protein kinase